MHAFQPSSPSPRQRLGFTLVEILVVITIISILIAVLVPRVSGILQRVEELGILSEVRQLDISLEKFKEEFGFYPPIFSAGSGPGYVSSAAEMVPYLNLISSVHSEFDDFPGEVAYSRLDYWWDRVGVALVAEPDASLWFWLSQLNNNAQYPLTGARDTFNAMINDDEKRVLFDFTSTQLNLLDNSIADYELFNGGNYPIFRYLQYKSDTDSDTPYVYIPNDAYPKPSGAYPSEPLAIRRLKANPFEYYNPNRFQIIAPGYDNKLHSMPPADPLNPLDLTNLLDKSGLPERDNITNFSESRLDVFVTKEKEN